MTPMNAIPPSCWTRVCNTPCSGRGMRASALLVSSFAILVLGIVTHAPISATYAMAGTLTFLGIHEMPKDGYSERARPSRTWKHILAGTLIFAGGLGITGRGMDLKDPDSFYPLAAIIGIFLSMAVCYTDLCFQGNYNYNQMLQDPINENGNSVEIISH